MIFRIAFIFKILLVLTVGETAYRFFRKKLSLKSSVLLVALIAIFAVFANAASERLPPLRDTVTLTALGEKREDAKKEEVYLSGFTVDGKGYNCLESLEIREGKWFWNGEKYCWRIETDPRQPEGMTRRVVLGIPVGRERSLDFAGSIWRGKVEIQTEDQTWVVDTYAENEETLSESIGSSRPSMLLKSELYRLFVFLVVFCALLAIEFLAVIHVGWLTQFVKKHRWVLLYAGIALFQLLIAMRYAGIDCFWDDELYEIGWSVGANTILERAFVGMAPLPIFGVFFHLCYLLAPYGEPWLLLPMEIGTALGIFVTGLAARECRGNVAGMFASAFAAVSSFLLYQCSYEVRSYPFFFLLAALLLLFYFKRLKMANREDKHIIAILSIVMVLFAGMHYHAVISCIALFVFDTILYLKKRIQIQCFLPYLLAGISYIPNAVCVFSSRELRTLNATWQALPNLHEVNQLLMVLIGKSEWFLGFLMVGVSVAAAKLCMNQLWKKEKPDLNENLEALPCFLMVFVLGFFLFYGNCINQSATLWKDRYFLDLLPGCYVLSGSGIAFLWDLFAKNMGEKSVNRIAFLFCIFFLTIPSPLDDVIQTAQKVRFPFREAADWLYEQSNTIFLDSTLVLLPEHRDLTLGWDEYYIQRQGRRDPVNVVAQQDIGENLLDYDCIYIVTINDQPVARIRGVLEQYYTQTQKNNFITVYQRR